MTVFKTCLTLAWRLKSFALIFFGIFFVMSIANTSQSIRQNDAFQEVPLEIAVHSPQNSPLSESFIDYLAQMHTVRRVNETEDQLRERVYIGEVDVAIMLPQDLEQAVQEKRQAVQLIVNPTSPYGAFLETKINYYFIFAQALAEQSELDVAQLNAVMAKRSQVSLMETTHAKQYDYTAVWAQFYFSFAQYVLVSVFIGIFGLLFADFEKTGNKQRILLGAKSLVALARQKFCAGLVVASLIFGVLVLGSVALQPQLLQTANFYYHIVVLIGMIFATLALAYLCIAIASDNKWVYSTLSTVLGVGLSFISGIFVPIDFVHPIAVQIAKIFPVYYAVQANSAIMRQQPYWHYVAILLLFALAYSILTLLIQHYRKNAKP